MIRDVFDLIKNKDTIKLKSSYEEYYINGLSEQNNITICT